MGEVAFLALEPCYTTHMLKSRQKAIALFLLYEDDLESKAAALYCLAGKLETLVDAQNFPPDDEELAEWASVMKRRMEKEGLMSEEGVLLN